MSWIDRGLCWAWTGSGPVDRKPPTTKRVEYVEVFLHADDVTPWQRIACGVWDDDRFTPMHTAEIASWAKSEAI